MQFNPTTTSTNNVPFAVKQEDKKTGTGNIQFINKDKMSVEALRELALLCIKKTEK